MRFSPSDFCWRECCRALAEVRGGFAHGTFLSDRACTHKSGQSAQTPLMSACKRRKCRQAGTSAKSQKLPRQLLIPLDERGRRLRRRDLCLLVKGQAGAIPPDFHGFPSEKITGFRTLDVVFVFAPVFARSGPHGPGRRGASDPGAAP